MSTAPEGATHLLPLKEGVRSEPVYYRTPSVHGVARWGGSRWEPCAYLPEAAIRIKPGPDARLIEAAPDLLKALQMCIAWMGDRRDVSPESIDAWVKGRYAIAKATGEQP